MVIHRFHLGETKHEFFGGMPESETSDRGLAEGWSSEKCNAWQLGLKKTISFCHLGAERQAKMLSTLNEESLDQFIFTAVYPTLMHIYKTV